MKFLLAILMAAQAPQSSFRVEKNGDERTVEITNVHYQVVESAGRHLVLRTTTHSKDVIGDIPEAGMQRVEAWPLGADFSSKPIYAVDAAGVGGVKVSNDVLMVDRSAVDLELWSLHRLKDGVHVMDTYTPPVVFSISKEYYIARFVGLDLPEKSKAVAVVRYASGEKVIREVSILCDDAKLARELKGYEDVQRTVAMADPMSIRVRLQERSRYEFTIPIVNDKLDLGHAKMPAGFRLQ